MTEPAPERISVSYKLTAAEYAGYAAAVTRRRRGWTPLTIFVASAFCAIPVALLFRALAAQRLYDPEAIRMAGNYSLYSFVLGFTTCWIGAALLGWIERRRYLNTVVTSGEPRTAEFDRTGVAVIAKGARAIYEWTPLIRCSFERNLLLVWISPQSAVAVPGRCFGSEAARAAALAFIRARLAEANAAAAAATSSP